MRNHLEINLGIGIFKVVRMHEQPSVSAGRSVFVRNTKGMAKAPLTGQISNALRVLFYMILPSDMDAGKRPEKPDSDEYLGHLELLR
ncbi:MAG: hypothetical protein JAY61_07365 [Candidatus Thiodiazotropha taylori]|nr:hypothetical protein [Candidatus Thiodiazotropha taylori]MCG7942905.1 hypothetical protein [Candidatus Thiodiazotropha taylori]